MKKFLTTFCLYKQHQSMLYFCALIVSLQSLVEFSLKAWACSRENSNKASKLLWVIWSFTDIDRKNKISKIFFLFSIFQVSTSTGVISHFVNLQVVVPEAFILGSGELHVDMGSAINLVCIIEKVGSLFCVIRNIVPCPFSKSSLYHSSTCHCRKLVVPIENFSWHLKGYD